jgi:peptidyl-prolyl cis-trans isomerase C
MPFADMSVGAACSLMLRVVREPLVQFIVLGAAVFAVSQYVKERSDGHTIRITPTQVQRLAEIYRQQYGRAASPDELGGLVNQQVEQEILYREALRLGLDQDDDIIRRRLVQKVVFLQQDLSIPAPPAEKQLLEYYRAHPNRYRQPPTVTFTHVYFSTDRQGEEQAQAAARAMGFALNRAGLTRTTDRGDRFPGSDDFVALSEEALARVFGRQGLTQAIFEVEIKHWSAPLRSGFGWHTVYVSAREPSRQRSFEEAEENIRRDFLEDQRTRRTVEAMARLRQPYRIVRGSHP